MIMMVMKFFEFSQNNSGGSFKVDDEVCHRVIIEAANAEIATAIATSKGIYFNGVADGVDCDCCGDRWHELWGDDEALDFPKTFKSWRSGVEEVTLNNVEEYAQYMADNYGWTTPDARIFYSNGEVKEIFTKEKSK